MTTSRNEIIKLTQRVAVNGGALKELQKLNEFITRNGYASDTILTDYIKSRASILATELEELNEVAKGLGI